MSDRCIACLIAVLVKHVGSDFDIGLEQGLELGDSGPTEATAGMESSQPVSNPFEPVPEPSMQLVCHTWPRHHVDSMPMRPGMHQVLAWTASLGSRIWIFGPESS